MTRTLLSPLRAGVLDLAHRVVMAPLTRMRAALPGNTPHALNVEYYRQRASKGGLLITEGSQISPMAQGLPATPGIPAAHRWKAGRWSAGRSMPKAARPSSSNAYGWAPG